jgi:hypothetical protein
MASSRQTFNLTQRRKSAKKASRNGGFFVAILLLQKKEQSLTPKDAKAQKKNTFNLMQGRKDAKEKTVSLLPTSPPFTSYHLTSSLFPSPSSFPPISIIFAGFLFTLQHVLLQL